MIQNSMTRIEDRDLRLVALTGGGSGIGRAIARGLAADGYNVAVLGRRMAALEETAAGHERIAGFAADLGDAAQATAAMARIEARFSQPIDGLIVAAALYPKLHFLDQDADSFTETVMTNICGVANAIRPVLPGMLARNLGRIVVVGSLADNAPIPAASAYSASKGGLHALVKALASEVDRGRYPNVLINELVPGATKTAMSDFGQEPEAVVDFIRMQLNFPSGGPTGRCWLGAKEIHLGESWKRGLLRAVLRRG